MGGTVFQASRKTFEASIYLKTLMSSDLAEDSLDPSGRLFVDRDPELFAKVLKLLRGYRFRSNAGLSWAEVKEEADFYQVPGLSCLAPEMPVLVIVPEEAVVVRRLALTEFVSKRGKLHYVISGDDVRDLPADLADRVYVCAPFPHNGPTCLDVTDVIAAGFHLKVGQNGRDDIDIDSRDDKWIYECEEKVVYYAKKAGTLLQVAKLHGEVIREDCPHWICITCRFKVST